MDEELSIRLDDLELLAIEKVQENLVEKNKPMSSHVDAIAAVETSFEMVKKLLNKLEIEM